MTLEKKLKLFGENGPDLSRGMHGIEREALRISQDGKLALTPHPQALGSAFDNPEITTDFSESQLELISAPYERIEDTLLALGRIHEHVVDRLGDERLWPFSMPCILPEEDQIPIAYYGESEEAMQKTIYRRGLALRYGKTMQMLCGVHYNFNFHIDTMEALRQTIAPEKNLQDFLNEAYLGLVRNFAKHRWLLIYLFGASPGSHQTYSCPHAKKDKEFTIALRMSKCGYDNAAKVEIDYNSYAEHIKSLREATERPHAPYTKLGLEKDGERIQLNDHILQIPNEYYFPIRIKASGGGSYLEGLEKHGVHYIEVRLFDTNPFEPLGVNLDQLRFTQVFLTTCLLEESPALNQNELKSFMSRQQEVAFRGRDTSLAIQDWAEPLFEKLNQVAATMGDEYLKVVHRFKATLENPQDLLSEKIAQAIEEKGFIPLGLELSEKHFKYLKSS